MDAALADLGARRAAEPLKIDALETTEPEAIAPQWVVDVVNGVVNGVANNDEA